MGKNPLPLGEDSSMLVGDDKLSKTFHSMYDIKDHIVWITKYCQPAVSEEIGRRVRE